MLECRAQEGEGVGGRESLGGLLGDDAGRPGVALNINKKITFRTHEVEVGLSENM